MRLNGTLRQFLRIGAAVLLVVGWLFPAVGAQAASTAYPEFFWGYVDLNTGGPAAGVTVTAWINGQLRSLPPNFPPTDAGGKFGREPTPEVNGYYLSVNGNVNDIIEFRVNGTAAVPKRVADLDATGAFVWRDLAPGEPIRFALAPDGFGKVTGVRLQYTPPPAPDTTPPAPITNLAAGSPTTGSVLLTWTAPGDDGTTGTAGQYDIRYLEGVAITDSNWGSAQRVTSVPAPSSAGSSENCTVGGLGAGKTYFFAIKTADPETNWSTISNSPSATTSAPDTVPPAAVTLAADSPTANNVTLRWTAPGDNGNVGTASAYSIRYLLGAAVTESNWSLATECPGAPTPSAAGSPETFVVTGLSSGRTYYFALKAADAMPNWSAISNSPSATTTGQSDTVPPAAVMDLAAGGATSNSIMLSWTAPGDNGTTGTASTYNIRYLEGVAITESNWASAAPCAGMTAPHSAGYHETFIVTGLAASKTYYFALKTADAVPNWSALSNIASAPTTAVTPPPPVGGGFGGGGGGGRVLTVQLADGTTASSSITADGIVQQAINAKSSQMTVTVAQGTKATKEKGTVPLDLVKVTVVSDPPAPATGNRLVGTVYKFEPEGAAFDPPISIAFVYDRAKLPNDVTEARLTVASYKDSTAGWLAQQSAVNTTDTTVTAKAAGLSVLGIMAPINTPVNTSTARPAAFSVSNLKVSPDRVAAGANVQVSLDLTNTGDLSGDYAVQLQVNQKPEASKTVTLAGGQTQTLSFSVSKTTPGGYMVQVGDKSTEFSVYRPASFAVHSLTLIPTNKDGTAVTVSAMVSNNGDVQGDRTVDLKVNGIKEGSATVTVAPASMQKATFSVVKEKPGRYDVEIEGLTSSFTVSGPGTTRWILIAEIVGAAVAGGAIWYFVVRRFFNSNRGTKPTKA